MVRVLRSLFDFRIWLHFIVFLSFYNRCPSKADAGTAPPLRQNSQKSQGTTSPRYILGITGGMGPLAGVRFHEEVINNTNAQFDQDAIDVLHASLASTIPDRIQVRFFFFFFKCSRRSLDLLTISFFRKTLVKIQGMLLHVQLMAY